jgi:hypothetical protein
VGEPRKGEKSVGKHPDISGSEQERQSDYFANGAEHDPFRRNDIAPTEVQRVELDILGEVSVALIP